jgi:hypothetical protein
VTENLALAQGFLAGHAAMFEWVAPRAGSVAFPRLRSGDAAKFAGRLVEGVLLLPGACFELPGPHFRIGLGRRDFAAGLSRLAGFVDRG